MNKSEMAYEQKRLAADLVGCGCFGIDGGMEWHDGHGSYRKP